MSSAFSVAVSLSPDIRQDIGIQALSRSQPISDLAATHQVSRKFVYQQGDKAQRSLDEAFAPSAGDDDVLFHLPVTKSWLYQLILGLVLICHSSYRGVVELLGDLFDVSISVGTIYNRLEAAATKAAEINQSQNLSSIEVGLHDEIFQSNRPVLVGVDAASTYCYLLEGVERRDEETWGWHLLDVMAQGFEPKYTIADGGSGLRAGQKAVMPATPCHGDVFHIQRQFGQVVSGLARQAQGATARRIKVEQQMAQANQTPATTRKLLIQQVKATRREVGLLARVEDIKTLLQWFRMTCSRSLALPSASVKSCLISSQQSFNSGAGNRIQPFASSQSHCKISVTNCWPLPVFSIARREDWAKRGLYLFELPAYSPELNLIEIVWRFMKYEWIDIEAYESWQALRNYVEEMLVGFGDKFVINFA